MRQVNLLLSMLVIMGWVAPARADIWQPSAAALCTATTYSALPVGQPEGTLCETTDTSRVYRYSAVAALWLMPDMRPAAMLGDYDGSEGLPTEDVPAWTDEGAPGTEAAAAAGGILTITDDGSNAGEYRAFSLVDAVNIVPANNVALIARVNVANRYDSASGCFNAILDVHFDASNVGGTLAIAYPSSAGADTIQMQPCHDNGSGLVLGITETTVDVVGEYRTLYVVWRTGLDIWEYGELGGEAFFASTKDVFTGYSSYTNRVIIGAFSSAGKAQVLFDWAKVFVF